MLFDVPSGRGVPIRDVLGKSKMILGLLEGIPTMHKGEIAMVNFKKDILMIRFCVCTELTSRFKDNIGLSALPFLYISKL